MGHIIISHGLSELFEYIFPQICNFANLPIRFDGIFEPRPGPAFFETAEHGALADPLPLFIEKRQLATRLGQTASQPFELRRRRGSLAGERFFPFVFNDQP